MFVLIDNILTDILSKWINIIALSKVDAAVTNQTSRNHFLQLISQKHFVHSTRTMIGHPLFIQWLSKREVKVKSLKLSADFCHMCPYHPFIKVFDNISQFERFEIDEPMHLLDLLENQSKTIESLKFCKPSKVVSTYWFDQILKHIHGLKSINLFANNLINSESYQYLVDKFPLLQSYTDFTCSSIVVTHCHQLVTIDVYWISSLSQLKEIATNCTNLEHLIIHTTINLYHDQNSADDGFLMIGANCKKLKTFSMVFPGITNDFIMSITDECCMLTKINIKKSNISDEALVKISLYCKQLTHLNCSNCAVGDFGITSVIHRCSLLTELVMNYCNLVTNLTLLLISRVCTKLEVLTFKSTTKTDRSLVRDILNCCPNLKVIHFMNTCMTNPIVVEIV